MRLSYGCVWGLGCWAGGFRVALASRQCSERRLTASPPPALSLRAMKLCKFVACAVVVAHWMACLWHLTRELNDAQCDWVAHYWGGGTGMQGDCSEVSASKAERYVAALYLAAMTISTVGYGDVPPQNLAERLYLVFATMIGGGVFAFVTGTVCSTVASMNIRETEFQQSMDACNRFIEEAYLSDELAERAKEKNPPMNPDVSSPEDTTLC